MTLNLNIPSSNPDLTPKITVIGVGGAGGNAVNNMIQSKLEGVEFLVANTDAQALQQSMCDRRTQLGRNITQGLGAGSRPDIGRAAAEEALDEILNDIDGQHMVFVTAGMGGGTGTGAAPVIARAAREAGLLTVGVVTKPFHFEGVHRMRLAEAGITELTQYVDTLIIIPNQNLFRVANEKTTFADAFKMADDVLDSGVRGVTDLMVNPGLINLDFADIRSVMSEMGKAMMGTGEADGDNRAVAAAEAAISNPLLDDVSMKGARGVLINITGGMDLTLFEVDEAANRIRDEVDPDANIIFGSTFHQDLEGRMRVSVVATGIDVDAATAPRPVSLSVISNDRAAAALQPPAVPETAAVRSMAETGLFLGGDDVDEEADGETAGVAIEAEQESHEPAPAAPRFEPEAAPMVAEAAPSSYDEGYEPDPIESDHESFFAPPAMEVEEVPAPVPEAEAEPFAAAELANATREPIVEEVQPQHPRPVAAAPRPEAMASRTTAHRLFAKVTGGAARAIQAAVSEPQASHGQARTPVRPDATTRPEPAPQRTLAGRTGEQARPDPYPAPATSSQPRLSGLDSAERIGVTEAEEDLLDIPAFLRRQAN
jgi:cell division protein FtsZ